MLSASLLALLLAANPLEPTSVKVYKGPEGEKVEVVKLKSPGTIQDALLRVSGTDSELDGRILRVEISTRGEAEDWASYQIKPGRYVLVTKRERSYELYIPGKRDGLRIAFDDKATGEAKAEPIIAAFEAANADAGTRTK